MAKKTILVSDLTGEEIEDAKAAQVVINYSDAAFVAAKPYIDAATAS